MRTEMIQAVISGGVKGRTGLGTPTNNLREGDFIRAEVLSSDKGVVTLKTSNGQILNAKLDANASFSPGDKVMLEVTAKENEIAKLSILREDEVLAGSQTTRHGSASGFEDRSLAPYAARLSGLNMPANEATAQAMRDLITQNPRMSLDQAAFIASNKLSANDGLLKAALALLSGGDKTDAMLQKLVDLLSTSNMSSLHQTAKDGNPTGSAPLMELFAQINESAHAVKAADGQNQQALAETLKNIISQTDSILQSRIAINNEQIVNNAQTADKMPLQNAQGGQISGQAIDISGNPAQINAQQPNYIQSTPQNQPQITNPDLPLQNIQPTTPDTQPPTLNAQDPTLNSQLSTPNAQDPILNSQLSTLNSPNPQLSNLTSQLTALLSELPEFQNTPMEALERFSSALLRVAGDSAQINTGDTEQLKMLLEKMFTRIERGDQDAGQRLQSAREEMFTRLSFLEEAIMRASPAARAELMEQTQRVMEHVRILNNIDQFVYMQLPVMLGEERKSAELYMFKKKGGKRVDPDNVNILLALDLQYLGHWEALLNIRNREVSIKMEVSGAAQKEHFGAHTVLLHNMLDEADFKLVGTDISYAQEDKTTPITALNTLDRYTAANARKIDFVV